MRQLLGILLAGASMALLAGGCSDDDPRECPVVEYPAFSELDGKSYVSEPTCRGPDVQDQVGPVEMRLEGDRLHLTFVRQQEDGTEVLVEEVWKIEEPPRISPDPREVGNSEDPLGL